LKGVSSKSDGAADAMKKRRPTAHVTRTRRSRIYFKITPPGRRIIPAHTGMPHENPDEMKRNTVWTWHKRESGSGKDSFDKSSERAGLATERDFCPTWRGEKVGRGMELKARPHAEHFSLPGVPGKV